MCMKIFIYCFTVFSFVFLNGAFSQSNIDTIFLKGSLNYGKNVAVFGGSVSCISASESAKNMWRNYLGMSVTTYGVSGAGFSSLQGVSMQYQVDKAGVYDIYILWASTNDYINHREIGSYTDYTEFDRYDKTKLTTQAGGINYCIKKIYEINPDAIIYFFTSSKEFGDRGGYDPFYSHGMVEYVEMQKKVCQLHGIPYLDQFSIGGFNIYNNKKFYMDAIHMNESGYKKLGELQVAFLAFPFSAGGIFSSISSNIVANLVTNNDYIVFVKNNLVTIKSLKEQKINIFNINGAIERRLCLNEGENTVSLSLGLHIIGNQKIVIK